MPENKNQSTGRTPAADSIVVKDYDGSFKVLKDGELRQLDELLADSETQAPSPVSKTVASRTTEVAFPKFTDLAPVPADEHFVQHPSKPAAGETVEHHFHPDDQAEIQRELDKLTTVFNIAPQKRYSISRIAKKLAEKHSLRLSEEELAGFTKALLSYFRQSRSLMQTREALMRSREERGYGVPAEQADRLLSVARHLKTRIEESDGTVVEEDIPEETMPSIATRSMPIADVRPPMPQKPPQSAPRPTTPSAVPAPQREAAPSIPKASQDLWPESYVAKVQSADVNVPGETKKDMVQNQVTAAPMPPSRPLEAVSTSSPSATAVRMEPPAPVQPVRPIMPVPQAESGRVTKMQRPTIITDRPALMTEVKRAPRRPAWDTARPMGRIDELAAMDLDTWRMLDPDPRIGAGKILGKIQSLEQESFTRKSQGIAAWRGSDVYRQYMMLGERSLETKKDVADIIRELSAQGTSTLSIEEFEAISDLNRMLRF